jgi:hypothetical protein
MRQVSTDTHVSHHTEYLGTDKDTPQDACPREETHTPNNRENSSRKRGTKDNKVFILITLQKKKKYLLLFAKKCVKAKFVFFFS